MEQLKAENKRLREALEEYVREIKAGQMYHSCPKCDGRGCSGPESNGMYQCMDCNGKGVRKIQSDPDAEQALKEEKP